MKLWHVLVAFVIASVAIWASNHVSAYGNIVS
jgi:hypothetical protein